MIAIVNRSVKTYNFAGRQMMDTFKDDNISATEKLEVRYVLIPRRTLTLAVVLPYFLSSR